LLGCVCFVLSGEKDEEAHALPRNHRNFSGFLHDAVVSAQRDD
jgi:hypothetical protein